MVGDLVTIRYGKAKTWKLEQFRQFRMWMREQYDKMNSQVRMIVGATGKGEFIIREQGSEIQKACTVLRAS